jgi:hypothetical protein
VNEKPIKSDLVRIDLMTDADIDFSDIPELDETQLQLLALSEPAARRPMRPVQTKPEDQILE